ncbi:MAG: ACP S-malonyltransferase [bacterium]
MNYTLVFPGQGSQSVGMLAELASNNPIVKDCFDEASQGVGIDLWDLAQNGPLDELNKTHNTQPALLAAGIAVWRIWQQYAKIQPQFLAGHSLGEYSALVAAGSISLQDGAKLVAARGQFMQEAVPAGHGAMAAILGLDDAIVVKLCTEIEGQVSAANFNSPGQIVVAGETEAVNRLVESAKSAGARRAVPLAVSVPSHCELMKPAAERLADLIEAIDFKQPQIKVIQNAEAHVLSDLDAIKKALVRQLYEPVRWTESITFAATNGVEAVGEAGPGKVLTGLMRRIDRSLKAKALENEESLIEAAHNWAGE